MEERLADIVVLYKQLSREVNIYIDTLLPKKKRPKPTSSSGSWDFGFQTEDDTTYDIENEERKYYAFNNINRISDKMVSYLDNQDDIDDIWALKEVLMESTDCPDNKIVSIDLQKYLERVGDIIIRKFEENKKIMEKQRRVIRSQREQIDDWIFDPNAKLSPIANKKDSLANHTTFGIKDKGFKWDEIYDYLVDKDLLKGSREVFIYAMTGEGDTPSKYPCLQWCGSKSEFSIFLRVLIGINRLEQFKTAVYIFSSDDDYGMGRNACRIVDDVITREQINKGKMIHLLNAATRLRDSTRVVGDKIPEQLKLDGDRLKFFKELSPAFDSFVNDRPGIFSSK